MNWLRKFMMGRYGVDQFSIALMVLSMALTLFGSFSRRNVFALPANLILVLIAFRVLSRNTTKRYEENQKFLGLWSGIKNWFQGKKKRMEEQKTHSFFHCPKCKQTLRVPKGKGKITITCPKCGTEFTKKT